MADSIAHGVARHNSDGWWLVEGTSWEGPRGAGAARSHASSVRPLGRAGAPLPEVAGRTSADFPTASLASDEVPLQFTGLRARVVPRAYWCC
jgi:hypothetical protein